MTRPQPEWLSGLLDRLFQMVPGEAVVVPETTSTKTVRYHLVPEETATGRTYICKKNKLGEGVVVTRQA